MFGGRSRRQTALIVPCDFAANLEVRFNRSFSRYAYRSNYYSLRKIQIAVRVAESRSDEEILGFLYAIKRLLFQIESYRYPILTAAKKIQRPFPSLFLTINQLSRWLGVCRCRGKNCYEERRRVEDKNYHVPWDKAKRRKTGTGGLIARGEVRSLERARDTLTLVR